RGDGLPRPPQQPDPHGDRLAGRLHRIRDGGALRHPDRRARAVSAVLDTVLDAAAAVCLVLGALMSLAAAIGLVRFPDLLTRMHAGTKPQVFGLLLLLTA